MCLCLNAVQCWQCTDLWKKTKSISLTLSAPCSRWAAGWCQNPPGTLSQLSLESSADHCWWVRRSLPRASEGQPFEKCTVGSGRNSQIGCHGADFHDKTQIIKEGLLSFPGTSQCSLQVPLVGLGCGVPQPRAAREGSQSPANSSRGNVHSSLSSVCEEPQRGQSKGEQTHYAFSHQEGCPNNTTQIYAKAWVGISYNRQYPCLVAWAGYLIQAHLV